MILVITMIEEMRNSTFSAVEAMATRIHTIPSPYRGALDRLVRVMPKVFRYEAESLVIAVEYTNTHIANIMKYSSPSSIPQFLPR